MSVATQITYGKPEDFHTRCQELFAKISDLGEKVRQIDQNHEGFEFNRLDDPLLRFIFNDQNRNSLQDNARQMIDNEQLAPHKYIRFDQFTRLVNHLEQALVNVEQEIIHKRLDSSTNEFGQWLDRNFTYPNYEQVW